MTNEEMQKLFASIDILWEQILEYTGDDSVRYNASSAIDMLIASLRPEVEDERP